MSFFGINTNCSGCKNLGNRNTDTVSVDSSKIQEVSRVAAAAPGKENSDPKQDVEEMRRRRAAEEVKKMKEEKEAEERRRRQQEEEERQRQKQREEEMQRKRAEEEAEEQRRAFEAEEARIAAEREQEEQRRLQAEAEEQERLRRQREEEEEAQRLREAAEEATRLKEEEEARKGEQLRAFLQKAGFQEATEKKVKKGLISSSFSYPLHAAVKAKDAEAVELLLWAGADPTLQNSKKQTPLELAQKKNDKKTQSHANVMAALAA